MTEKKTKEEKGFKNMKIDYQELIKRLKEVNKKWFDKDLDD